MTHRISSLPALARAVDAVPASERHARAVAVVADALDLLVDPTGVAGDVGAVLLDERGTPGSRREAYRELAAVADSLDAAAAAARVEGDYAGYLAGFQAARVVSALALLVAGGAAPSSAALADVVYEAVMVTGSDSAVLARLTAEG
ncbi:hypothetical protein GCM10023147_16790 [Tsukamurella soli]|uniref:Uncharacterized protein n=1 Tax=Tsukamurella soli TaxID=644556 RepID=A0ABP8JER2_9ACTN